MNTLIFKNTLVAMPLMKMENWFSKKVGVLFVDVFVNKLDMLFSFPMLPAIMSLTF